MHVSLDRADFVARIAFAFVATLATLSGRVLDTTTGQPLPGVWVEAGKAHALTDARGRFTLHGVRPGTVAITLESGDVPAQHVTVHVTGPSTLHDLHACSTTLDYNCGSRAPDGSGGAG